MSKTGAESDHSAGEEQCGAWSHFVRETPDSCGVTDEVEVHFHPQTPSRPRGFPSRSAHRRHRRAPHLPQTPSQTSWVFFTQCPQTSQKSSTPSMSSNHVGYGSLLPEGCELWASNWFRVTHSGPHKLSQPWRHTAPCPTRTGRSSS